MSERNGLPKGWARSTIGEVAKTKTGGTPSRGQADYFTGQIPWVKSGELGDRVVFDTEEKITEEAVSSSSAKLFPKGTLCIALYGATIGKLGILGIDATTNQAICGIFLPVGVDSRYVFRFLEWKRPDLIRLGQGGAQPNISNSLVRQTELLLAPCNEQRRIVAKIEELFSDLDAGVAALERIKANLKRYRAAVLKAAVEGRLTEAWRAKHPKTEPASKLLERILAERRQKWEEDQLAKFANADKTPPKGWREKYVEPAGPDTSGLPELPKGWCWTTLEQLNIAERPMSYGVLQPGEDQPDGIPLVRVCDVADGQVAVERLKRIDPAISAQYRRTILRGGEVLLTIVGTIGRTAVVPQTLAGANTARAIAVIAVAELLDPRFVEISLRESRMRATLTNAAHEVARKTLNLEDVRVASIRLPPLEEQTKIIAEVERCLSIVKEAEAQADANLKRAARLRQSILKRAFEGNLVPQDPTDEPADKLLERIRQARESDNMQESKNGSARRRTKGKLKASTKKQDGRS